MQLLLFHTPHAYIKRIHCHPATCSFASNADSILSVWRSIQQFCAMKRLLHSTVLGYVDWVQSPRILLSWPGYIPVMSADSAEYACLSCFTSPFPARHGQVCYYYCEISSKDDQQNHCRKLFQYFLNKEWVSAC